VEQARRLPLRIAADSVRSILHREVKCREVGRATAAVAGIGIGRLPVRAPSRAATRMATGEDRHARSSTCVSQSCEARRTAEADIRAEVIALPAMVGRAAHRGTRGRVMAAVAPGRHLAAVEVTRPVAAAEVTRAVEAGVATRVAEVEVIPEVVDIPATTKRVDHKLM